MATVEDVSAAESVGPEDLKTSRDVLGVRISLGRRACAGALWVLAVLACWVLGAAASLLAVPSPYLVTAAVVGITCAVSGRVCKQFPGRVNVAAQAVIGIFLGSYVDLEAVNASTASLVTIFSAIIGTVVVCLLAGWLLPRLIPIDILDGVLGMAPGNSAALVGIAEEVRANAGVVAFVQYLRVAMVAASLPFIIAFGSRSTPGTVGLDDSPFQGVVDDLKLVESDSQSLGVAGVVVLCVAGYLVGRLVRLPAPAITGTLLLSAAIPQVINESCSPSELVRQLMFVVMGLEIGLRFQRATLQKVWRLLPKVALMVVIVGALSGLISVLFALALRVPFVDAYLAIAPGGLNPLLASAVSADADILLVASVQILRLLLALVIIKLICRWFINRRAPAYRT
jgi:membrane AbrB-like protein